MSTLFNSDLIRIRDRRAAWRTGHYQGGNGREITLVRKGMFAVDGAGELVVAHNMCAAVYDGRSDYELTYPVDCQIACIQIKTTDALMDEAIPADRYSAHLNAKTVVQHLSMYAALVRGQPSQLGIEEAAVQLLGVIGEVMGRSPKPRPATRAVRRRLENVCALMTAEPHINHSLAHLADVGGCSPFHLAHLFRQETGHTLRGYRAHLRSALVAARISEGAANLSEVAHEAGFCDHSHMTTTFQRLDLPPPRELRDRLAGPAGVAPRPRSNPHR